MTRLFFTTDVHGSDRCFRKFLNAAKVFKADALILGGDITGKVLIPIVERPDGRYELTLFSEKKTVGKDKLEETRKLLQDAGQYSFLTTPSELTELQADAAKQDSVFDEAMASVLRAWIALAQERLKGSHVKCYVSPGNDDKLDIDSTLVDSGQFVNPENRAVDLDGEYEMITLGFANPTPWHSPREVSEEELGEMIEKLASQVKRPENAVYNLHVPPIGTELDRAPAVSHDFNYVKEGLGIKFIHAGSTAVRKSIEIHAPLLGLHGHIHESKGFVKIGRTLCLNPGSEYSDGILRGALANLQDGKVHDFVLTSG
ncbi:MAG: metallophosphoesterase [Nitrososphaerota archaeon]|nr:metallophosphoesterase [Nitrososphaerota archaeon]